MITVVSQHGRPDNGSDAAGFFNAEFFVPLKPFDEWPSGMTKEKLVEQLQAEFEAEFTGIGFNFSQYIQDNVEEGLSGVKGANSVKIFGPDLGHWNSSPPKSCVNSIRFRGSPTSVSSGFWASRI